MPVLRVRLRCVASLPQVSAYIVVQIVLRIFSISSFYSPKLLSLTSFSSAHNSSALPTVNLSSAANPGIPYEHKRTDRSALILESLVPANEIIPAEPWLAKRDRSLTVNEYLASYLGFLDVRRFQISLIGQGDQTKTKITVNDRTYDVSTRYQSWLAHCRHMGTVIFVSSVYATLDCDTPISVSKPSVVTSITSSPIPVVFAGRWPMILTMR